MPCFQKSRQHDENGGGCEVLLTPQDRRFIINNDGPEAHLGEQENHLSS